MKVLYFFRKHYFLSFFIAIIISIAIVARIYLGVWVLDYVNSSLNNIGAYHGSVKNIRVDLYRGAYRIYGLKIVKESGKIPTPFINIDKIDLSIQWSSLIHGRVVSDIELDKPVLNFAVSEKAAQNGGDADWTQPIKALAPVDINHVIFNNGTLTYQDFSTNPKVDIYIHHMTGEVSNLRNVVYQSQPLPSKLTLEGDSIGQGKLKIEGRLNILKQVPDMDIKTQMEDMNLTALNDYSNAYAAIDIKSGKLSLYSEFIIKNNNVSGYVKPIATNVSLIDLHKDSNPVKVVWESFVAIVLKAFTNLPHDQFATKIQLEGNLDHINTNAWSAIGGIFHNAFIKALNKGMDKDIEGNSSPATYHIK